MRNDKLVGMKVHSEEDIEGLGYILLDDEDLHLRNNIKDLLDERNITASDLAKLIGMSRQNINMIIREKMIPSVEFALKTAYVLGVKVEDLFELSGTAWIHQVASTEDVSIYLDTLSLEIIGHQERKRRADQDKAEFWSKKTGDKLTKKEYEQTLREFLRDHQQEYHEQFSKMYPDHTRNQILSLVSDTLKAQFDENHPKLYKKIGVRYEPERVFLDREANKS